jgi:hypothetical protein
VPKQTRLFTISLDAHWKLRPDDLHGALSYQLHLRPHARLHEERIEERQAHNVVVTEKEESSGRDFPGAVCFTVEV